MSREFDLLRAAYPQVAAIERTASGEPCPTPEAIVLFVTGKRKRKEGRAILPHLTRCPSCAREARIFLGLSREIDEAMAAVQDSRPAPRLVKTARRGAPAWRARPAAVAALSILAFGLGSFLIFRPRIAPPVLRSGGRAEVRLVTPVREKTVSGAWIFDWKPIRQAESYTVEVFDRTLSSIWKSGPLHDARLAPPEELRLLLKAGSGYFWSVTARLPNGLLVKSRLGEFALRR